MEEKEVWVFSWNPVQCYFQREKLSRHLARNQKLYLDSAKAHAYEIILEVGLSAEEVTEKGQKWVDIRPEPPEIKEG